MESDDLRNRHEKCRNRCIQCNEDENLANIYKINFIDDDLNASSQLSTTITTDDNSQPVTHNLLNNACTRIDPTYRTSPRSKQRRFVARRLSDLQDLGANVYSEIMIEPILQYFVANLCDLKVQEHQRKRIGLRYARTPEVQRLVRRVRKAKALRQEIVNTDPNVIIAVLRQLLADFPGGIFDDRDEEFLCVSLQSSLNLALDFVHSLVQELPIFLRQFSYMVCKSLRNLAQQSSGSLVDSYTDLLMLFTPVLFPNSVGEVSRFLRATRITLILVDMCDAVFPPFLEQSALTDSAYHSDEDFFADVMNTLNQLSDSFHVAGGEPDNGGSWLELDTERRPRFVPVAQNNNEYYQITYM